MTDASRPSIIDPAEVEKFDRLAREWWDTSGPMAPLHKFNPVRLAYLRDLLTARLVPAQAEARRPLAGLRVLDVGCGGGVLCEPLARLGASVTGIDPAPTNVEVARLHAEQAGLAIEYRVDTVEALAAAGERFDAVLAMEVVEHVPDVPAFTRALCACVRPGGMLVMATINRTLKSFALAIVGAEYVLRWLPRGTHDWSKFVTPAELEAAIRSGGLEIVEQRGVTYNPLADAWRASRDTDVNYMLAAMREG